MNHNHGFRLGALAQDNQLRPNVDCLRVKFEFLFLHDLEYLQFLKLLHYFMFCPSDHLGIKVSSIHVVIHQSILQVINSGSTFVSS